jgi:methyltransferase (TIGR00027 family)
MRDETPSFTAAWVAAMRGLGAFLPEGLRLIDDPYGVRFSRTFRRFRGPKGEVNGVASATERLWFGGYLRRFAVYMQLRTRVIDDDMVAFARAGGRQIVLLGAGFDCRAWRLAALSGATVFEVDHPATQKQKRAIVGDDPPAGRVVFVPWNFERPLPELPARLASEGHDASAPTMTVLEGVLMYLTPEATDATFECIRQYSAPGSPVAITFMDKSLIEDRSREGYGRRFILGLAGEPLRNGFEAGTVPAWLEARGFRLERDETVSQLGTRFLGPTVGRRIESRRHARSHFALVRRV